MKSDTECRLGLDEQQRDIHDEIADKGVKILFTVPGIVISCLYKLYL